MTPLASHGHTGDPARVASVHAGPRMQRWVSAAVALSTLALVAPNHSPPWVFFVQELLCAVAFAVLAVGVLITERQSFAWTAPHLLVVGLLGVVAAQYVAGLIETRQAAWLPALYMLGLLMALHTGAALQRREPMLVLQVLLLPALLAGAVSVGLQMWQWLVFAPGESTLWIYRSGGARPAANLGQPNLLATVHVLALLGLYGLWRLQKWPGVLVGLLAALPMVGLALTQSRTGLLNAGLVAAALLAWDGQRKPLRWVLPLLASTLLLLFAGYALFGQAFGATADPALASGRMSAGTRPLAWRLLASAALQQPLFGYGWGQTFSAHLAGAPFHTSPGEVFLNAHNLLLDLAIWGGLPFAGTVTAAGAVWFVVCARRSTDIRSRLVLLAVAVLTLHSMFEYPFTYSFFLLPAGLAIGALSQRVELATVWRSPRALVTGLLLAALAAAAVTVQDHLRVEQAYRVLLMEKARIQITEDRSPPDVLVLDSLRELIVFSRTVPVQGLSDEQLQSMARVVRAHPGAHGFARLAQALALNGHPEQAQLWVDQLCRIFVATQCHAQAEAWATEAGQQPALRGVRWP